MNRVIVLSSVAAACAGLAAPSFSAEPATSPAASVQPSASAGSPPPSTAGCSKDIRDFSGTMRKAGNWIASSDYGYGYPVDGYGYGFDYPMAGYASGASFSDLRARPGYEIRNLLTSANILAQSGDQKACEAVLAAARTVYGRYATDYPGRDGWMGDGSGWRQRQIASATAVGDTTAALRSDRLIDTDVRSPQGDALGSVHDLVIDPETGKISYLIMARGGLFGFDEKFVPVPWNDFKIAPNGSMLVLDATKAVVAAAPTATDAQFRAAGQFAAQSQKVDAYWTANMPRKAASE